MIVSGLCMLNVDIAAEGNACVCISEKKKQTDNIVYFMKLLVFRDNQFEFSDTYIYDGRVNEALFRTMNGIAAWFDSDRIEFPGKIMRMA